MYCAFSFPSPIYNSKTGGVSYDFFVVGTIDDAETVEKRRKYAVVVPSKSASPPPHTSCYDGNVEWMSSPFEFHSSGLTGPIHTLGGVACYVSNGTEKNIRLQFNLVYSSGFTGPLYFDVTESPSRHCQ